VGIVGNANYAEMADCMAGFFGIDFAGDDGRQVGRWPWEPQEGERPISAAAQKLHEKFFSKAALRGGRSKSKPRVPRGRRVGPKPPRGTR